MDLQNFPHSDGAKRMLSYVTKGWYDNSYIGKWVFEVLGLEIDSATQFYEELPYQMFIETATWGLKYHEQKYGLPVRKDLSYEERRALIIQKRDLKYPMVPQRMETLLFERFGVEVHVHDTNDPGGFVFEHPNIFSVQFVQDGIEHELDLQVARQLIEKLKLSHTMYILRYLHFVRVQQDINYSIGVEFSVGVEARSEKNIGYTGFFLDGTYLLDGKMLLNGYKEPGIAYGLYECATRYVLPCNIDIQLNSKEAYSYDVNIQSQPEIKTEAAMEVTFGRIEPSVPKAEMVASIVQEAEYTGNIGVCKNLWRLDGTYLLNGEELLNAEEYILKL